MRFGRIIIDFDKNIDLLNDIAQCNQYVQNSLTDQTEYITIVFYECCYND